MARQFTFGMRSFFASPTRTKRIRFARWANFPLLLPAVAGWIILAAVAPVRAQDAKDPNRVKPMALAPPAPSARSLAEKQETFFEVLARWPRHTPLFSINEQRGLTVRCNRLPRQPAPPPPVNPFDVEVPTPRASLPESDSYGTLLREMVLQDQWDGDGPGRIAVLPGVIVVRQTRKGHDAVADFLSKTVRWEQSRTESPFD